MNLNLLRRQAIISSQARKKNLPYLCELEYLESTGEQRITISYREQQGDTYRHETEQMYTKITGSQYEGNPSANWYGVNPNGVYLLGTGAISTVSASTSGYDKIVFEKTSLIPSKSTQLKVNGEIIASRDDSTVATTNIVGLFKMSANAYSCYIRKKYHKFYVNGELYFDGIPVLDYNMKPAMYDRVTKTFFYNEGTGADFKYGRQIHYCDCIIGTGEQYIDTGFSPDSNTSFEAIFTKHSTTTKAIFGSRRLYQQDSYCVSFMNAGGLKIDYGSSAVTTDFRVVNQKIYLKKEKEKNYIDGNEYTANIAQTFSVVPTFLLFSVQNADGTTATKGDMALYMAKLWDNDVLVRDYKPAYDENGVAFIFDKVTHTIYDNAGTGAFKAGFEDRDGNLYTSVPYIESTGGAMIRIDIPIAGTQKVKHVCCQQYVTQEGRQLEGFAQVGRWFGTNEGYYHITSSSKSDVMSSTTDFDKIVFESEAGRQILTVNGTEILTMSQASLQDTIGIRLFAAGGNSYVCYLKKKYHLVYLDNKLVFAGVPVVNTNGVAGLFDVITKTMFKNSFTGEFLIGE